MPAPRRVKEGEEWWPSTESNNAFVDAWQYVQDQQRIRQAGTGRDLGSGSFVSVRNDSGADRARFDLLGLDGPVFSPDDNPAEFKNRVLLKGVTPTLAHVGQFVLLDTPIPAGKIGRGIIAGVTPAQVDFSKGRATHADVLPDVSTTHLTAITSGTARIRWAPTSPEGLEWCVVQLGSQANWIDVQLAEDCPDTPGQEFDVWLGWWDPATAAIDYDTSKTYKALDWRYGENLPKPQKCATGRAEWMPDDTLGQILYCVDLDCDDSHGCEGYY